MEKISKSHYRYLSLALIAILAALVVFSIGKPQSDSGQNVKEQVNYYIEELYKVKTASDGVKSHFLSRGFCFDDTLENLAAQAELPEEILAVDSLAKDCIVLASRLQKESD